MSIDHFERAARSIADGSLYQTLGNCHPKLTRGQVWCRTCGFTQQVSAAYAFKHGWPKCCGATMTIDAPGEDGSC